MAYSARKSVLVTLARIWARPLWWGVRAAGVHELVQSDVDRFVECIGNHELDPMDPYSRFAYLAGALTEFRTAVHFRLRSAPVPLRLVLRLLYRPEVTLTLEAGSIGPGLFIHHGGGTIVTAESIGSNFWVNHNVSVGYTLKGRPTIGNNVTIATGAVVVGPITIGDGALIGANAVVSKDVPAGAVMLAPKAVQVNGPASSNA